MSAVGGKMSISRKLATAIAQHNCANAVCTLLAKYENDSFASEMIVKTVTLGGTVDAARELIGEIAKAKDGASKFIVKKGEIIVYYKLTGIKLDHARYLGDELVAFVGYGEKGDRRIVITKR